MFSVCNSYFSMLLSHPSTSAPWKTALSVCLCCWPQQSKIIISSTQLFSVLHILTRTHNMLAALLLLLHIANAFGSPHVRGSDSFLFPAVSQMWWCQHTPRTAGPVFSSLFTSPSNSTSSWTWYGSHCKKSSHRVAVLKQQPLVTLRHLNLCHVDDSKDVAVCFFKGSLAQVGIFWDYDIIICCVTS